MVSAHDAAPASNGGIEATSRFSWPRLYRLSGEQKITRPARSILIRAPQSSLFLRAPLAIHRNLILRGDCAGTCRKISRDHTNVLHCPSFLFLPFFLTRRRNDEGLKRLALLPRPFDTLLLVAAVIRVCGTEIYSRAELAYGRRDIQGTGMESGRVSRYILRGTRARGGLARRENEFSDITARRFDDEEKHRSTTAIPIASERARATAQWNDDLFLSRISQHDYYRHICRRRCIVSANVCARASAYI